MSTQVHIPWTINATTTGRRLVSYRYQSEARNYQWANPQPVYQNREPLGYNPWSINATTTGCDLDNHWYQLEACNYQCQINGHDPQPAICQNRERLLSCSKQYGVSISTNVFEFICYKLNLKNVITIPTPLSLLHD